MRKVEKTAAGRYKVRFRYGGKQTSETFKTRLEADRFVKWLAALGAQGALDQLYAAEQQATVPSMDELAAEDFSLRPDTTEGTRLGYERLWARTWGPIIGHIPANQLTEDDLTRGVMRLAETYSRKSLENQHGMLSGVVRRAAKKGYLPENIARGLKLPAGKHGDKADMRILTPDEYEDILTRIPAHYRTFVDFLAGTGCRWGEAVALEVRDLAFPNVRIRRALKWSPDNNRTVGPPKTTKSNRTVWLPPELIPELRAAKEGKASTDLVFTAPRGGAILHRTFWSRVWLPAVRHLEPRPRIHDLRHSHVSTLLAAGIPIHVVQARLGHEDIATTVNTYGHLLPDAQMRAAQAASVMFQARPQIES